MKALSRGHANLPLPWQNPREKAPGGYSPLIKIPQSPDQPTPFDIETLFEPMKNSFLQKRGRALVSPPRSRSYFPPRIAARSPPSSAIAAPPPAGNGISPSPNGPFPSADRIFFRGKRVYTVKNDFHERKNLGTDRRFPKVGRGPE